MPRAEGSFPQGKHEGTRQREQCCEATRRIVARGTHLPGFRSRARKRADTSRVPRAPSRRATGTNHDETCACRFRGALARALHSRRDKSAMGGKWSALKRTPATRSGRSIRNRRARKEVKWSRVQSAARRRGENRLSRETGFPRRLPRDAALGKRWSAPWKMCYRSPGGPETS